MEQNLLFGYSPCPNDTYIFYALANGRIETAPFFFDVFLADVEVLNQKTRQGLLDVSKVSISAVLHLLRDYRLLRCGGALGRGCGPLVVAKRPMQSNDLHDALIAIPGNMTTAHLLLKLTDFHHGGVVEMPFDRIMGAVVDNSVDAGLIIHEGRFTYPALGLKLVLDLGAWWEDQTGLPLPLGGIVIKRQFGRKAAETIENLIRKSLRYARAHGDEAWPYIVRHAQEMAPEVINQHIAAFVNDFSLDIGDEGEKAIRILLESAARIMNVSLPKAGLFWDDSPKD